MRYYDIKIWDIILIYNQLLKIVLQDDDQYDCSKHIHKNGVLRTWNTRLASLFQTDSTGAWRISWGSRDGLPEFRALYYSGAILWNLEIMQCSCTTHHHSWCMCGRNRSQSSPSLHPRDLPILIIILIRQTTWYSSRLNNWTMILKILTCK